MKATLAPKRLSRVPLVSILVNMYYTVYLAHNYWAGSEKEGHGWARMAQKGVSPPPRTTVEEKHRIFGCRAHSLVLSSGVPHSSLYYYSSLT